MMTTYDFEVRKNIKISPKSKAQEELLEASNEYVVSDESGNYVDYTSTFIEAEDIAAEGNAELIEQDLEGSYAVGIKRPNGTYTFEF